MKSSTFLAPVLLFLAYGMPAAIAQDNPFVQFNVSGTFLNRPNDGPAATLGGWFIVNQNNGKVVKADLFHGSTELTTLTDFGNYPDIFIFLVTDPPGDLLSMVLWAPASEGSLADYTGGVVCPGPPCMGVGTSFLKYPFSYQNNDDLAYGSVTEAGSVPLVKISIKLGSSPPIPINPRSHGLTTVAIISTPQFDAVTEVDTRSLTFGATGEEHTLAFCDKDGEDINGDRLPDLICHFTTRSAQFQPSSPVGILFGKTMQGSPFVGIERVAVKPTGQ